MDYSFGVGGIQSFGYLDPKLQCFFEWERLPTDMTAQCFAVHELHGDESSAVLLADVIDRANAGMIQGGCGSRLAAKPLQRLRVLRHVIWQEFQCNRALQTRINCLIDHAHSPCAQFFYDAKVRDGLVNHC